MAEKSKDEYQSNYYDYSDSDTESVNSRIKMYQNNRENRGR